MSSRIPLLRDQSKFFSSSASSTRVSVTASSQAVTETLVELAEELKNFDWSRNSGIRLLISAGKVGKRKTFFKTLDKIGLVETFSAWSADDQDWVERAEAAAVPPFSSAGFRVRLMPTSSPTLPRNFFFRS